MIVRISGEGQFELADSESGRLNELEAAVIAAVEACDEAAYGAGVCRGAAAERLAEPLLPRFAWRPLPRAAKRR